MSMNWAIFSSQQGSTFESLVRAWKQHELSAQTIILISDNLNSGAVKKAKQLEIPYFIHNPKNYHDVSSWAQDLLKSLKQNNIHFILLAGFLKKIPHEIIKAYDQRIVNTHPSLLPKFSGQGMYGTYIHEAVLKAGEKETGISLHFVTENYDEGPIIAQHKVTVYERDTVQSLEQRVKAEEKKFLIEQINHISTQSF